MRSLAPFPLPEFSDLKLVRPLLGFTRAELRSLLEQRGIAWREDPMNADSRFARARLRAVWPALEKVRGLSSQPHCVSRRTAIFPAPVRR